MVRGNPVQHSAAPEAELVCSKWDKARLLGSIYPRPGIDRGKYRCRNHVPNGEKSHRTTTCNDYRTMCVAFAARRNPKYRPQLRLKQDQSTTLSPYLTS
jgi:hypothetical protein